MEEAVDYNLDLILDQDSKAYEDYLFNMTAPNSTFVPVMPPVISKTINLLLVVVLTITMVSMGCTMEVSKIKVTSGDMYCMSLRWVKAG